MECLRLHSREAKIKKAAGSREIDRAVKGAGSVGFGLAHFRMLHWGGQVTERFRGRRRRQGRLFDVCTLDLGQLKWTRLKFFLKVGSFGEKKVHQWVNGSMPPCLNASIPQFPWQIESEVTCTSVLRRCREYARNPKSGGGRANERPSRGKLPSGMLTNESDCSPTECYHYRLVFTSAGAKPTLTVSDLSWSSCG